MSKVPTESEPTAAGDPHARDVEPDASRAPEGEDTPMPGPDELPTAKVDLNELRMLFLDKDKLDALSGKEGGARALPITPEDPHSTGAGTPAGPVAGTGEGADAFGPKPTPPAHPDVAHTATRGVAALAFALALAVLACLALAWFAATAAL